MLRYGFVDGIDHTLEEINQVYGITRERVRQIESKILTKIRKSKGKYLKELLEN